MSHPSRLTLPPPKNLNKNNRLEAFPKRRAPARRFLLSVVSSLLLGGLVLGWPGTSGAQNCEATAGVPVTGDLATDCATLLGLKAALLGSTTATLNWDAAVPMVDWDGVTVVARVTVLLLNNKDLRGVLPAALNRLTGLTQLNLSHNQLSGEIPDLSGLTALEILHLNNNQLSGPVPDLSGLTALTSIDLDNNNQLSGICIEGGVLATGDLAADCATLLGLKDVLRGTATLNWTDTPHMNLWAGVTVGGTPLRVTRLRLGNKDLTGVLPAALNRLTGLEVLHLDNNQLSGPIPDLSGLTALTELDLSTNQLSGPIPDLSGLTALTRLVLDNNNFTAGPIPPWVNSLTGLTHLHLNNTNRTGPIPNLSSLTALRLLHLHNNNFTPGPIPPWINDLTTLAFLDLGNTNRNRAIPNLSALTSLQILELSDNQLSGPIPDLSGLAALYYLVLDNNNFTAGPIPPWTTSMSRLTVLRLNNTNRTGAIPDLRGSGTPKTNWAWLDLGNNNFDEGVIPTWMNDLTSLQSLVLANTNRTGAIPNLSGLSTLYVLDLSNNNFTAGPIPAWVTAGNTLTNLHLANTNRTGTFPALSALTLLVLDLSNNDFTDGVIPPWMSTETTLRELRLANTDRTGAIPDLSGLAAFWRFWTSGTTTSPQQERSRPG